MGFVFEDEQPTGRFVFEDEAKDDKMEWGQALKSGFKNLPRSAKEYFEPIAKVFSGGVQALVPGTQGDEGYAKDAAVGLWKTASGGVQKLIPGQQENEATFDAVVDHYKNKYGSLENFKKEIAERPVEVLGDASMVLMGTGGVAKVAGMGGTLSKIGSTVTKVGANIEPTSIAMRMAAAPTKLIPKEMPNKMYRSSAKFSTTMPVDKRKSLAQLALDKEIMPTVKGVDKAEGLIDDINSVIVSKIDDATQSGQKVLVDELFLGFDELKDKYSLSGRPIEFKTQIQKIEDGLKKNFSDIGKTTLTPQEAQKLKQTIYKDIGSWYSKTQESPAIVKAQKLVAKNAKESLEQIVPEIKQLNQKEGALIELKEALERSSSRIANRDLIGIGTPIKATMGGVVGGPGGALTGLAMGILDTPTVKAKLAIILNNLKKKEFVSKARWSALRAALFANEQVAEE